MMPIRNPITGSNASESTPNTEIRMGNDTAIANGPLKPGVAPTTIPLRKPANTMTIVIGIGIPATVAIGAAVNTARTPAQM